MSLKASFTGFQQDRTGAAARNAQHLRRVNAGATPNATAAASASTPSPRPLSPAVSASNSDLKRKRTELAEAVTYSQPTDTGSGKEVMTQVVYAIDYLKLKDKPISFNDIWNYLSIPANQQQHKAVLRRALKEHPKVDYDEKGPDGHPTFRFRPMHNVRSGEELRGYMQRQSTAQGVSVKELKDGWPTAIAEIEALERRGELLVTKNKKDNTPKMVWSNDPSLALHIDQDFQDFWAKTKLPANPSDMRNELEKAGMTPTSQVKEVIKLGGAKEKKRRINRKIGRSTNTHMSHILKDYTQVKK